MKAEPGRLIPQKLAVNLELLIVNCKEGKYTRYYPACKNMYDINLQACSRFQGS